MSTQSPRRSIQVLFSGGALLAMVALVIVPANASKPIYPQPVMIDLVEPFGVLSADVNADGSLDVVSMNSGSDTVSVLLGHGDGSLDSALSFVACTAPGATKATLGDFNEDGDLDLAVACGFGETMSVLLGNGDGTFGAATQYAQAGVPIGIATGDFNEDDHPDLVLVGINGLNMTLHEGNGDGTFGPAVSLTGAGYYTVVVDDFNGDDHDDIASDGGDQASVWLGNGDGTFLPAVSYPAGDYTRHVSSVDLNHDDIPDLVTANKDSDDISVLIGFGDGTFRPQKRFNAGSQPSFTVPIDLNGDGDLDLVVSNYDGPSGLSLLMGNGTGQFANGGSVDENRPGGAYSVAAGDFDDDGDDDLVRGCFWCSEINLLFAADTDFDVVLREGVGGDPQSVAVADFNGDGRPDIAVANESSNDVSLLTATAAAEFASGTPLGAGLSPSGVAVGLITDDTVLDLAVANRDLGDLMVFAGNGDGTFSTVAGLPVLSATLSSVAVGDLNEDGREDMAASDEGSGSVQVVVSQGSALYTAKPPVLVGTTPSSVVIAYFDADTHLDLAVANAGSGDVSIRLGVGDGTFTAAPTVSAGSAPTAVAAGDLDGDTLVDLAVVHEGSDDVRTFLGNGDGTFSSADTESIAAWPANSPADPESVAIEDVDGDGNQDVVATTRGYRVSVFLGNGDGTLQPEKSFVTRGPGSSVAVADFNADGRLDLAAANETDDSLSILLNHMGPSMLVFESEEDLAWPAVTGALSYNVYRGELSKLVDIDLDGLPDDGYGLCMTGFDGDPSDTSFRDTDLPVAGEGYFYLHAVMDSGGGSGLGHTSSGLTRVPESSCP